jgi:pyruvate,orthophosphate dikinase
VEFAKEKKKVILVRQETSPEDIEGMIVVEGVLTARGGMTSHAAVVARGMGRCCVAGCADIKVDEEKGQFICKKKVYKEGDSISLNGSTGDVYDVNIKTEPASLTPDFNTIMQWADKHRALKIRTNADTPGDAAQAIKFGAEGIGLTRTEHMFFDADRIGPMREMIVSKTFEERKKALAKL